MRSRQSQLVSVMPDRKIKGGVETDGRVVVIGVKAVVIGVMAGVAVVVEDGAVG